MDSLKAQTNKKWTSSEDYRDNFDKIFKKAAEKKEETPSETEIGVVSVQTEG